MALTIPRFILVPKSLARPGTELTSISKALTSEKFYFSHRPIQAVSYTQLIYFLQYILPVNLIFDVICLKSLILCSS